jgi:Fe-S-cluster containining protein
MKKFKCHGCAGCCVSKFPKYILDAESPGYAMFPVADDETFNKKNRESAIAHGFILSKEDIKKINSLGLTSALKVARTLVNPKTKKAEISICINRTPFNKKGTWVWACCFLNDELKCDIYGKRPTLCAAYPFILKDTDKGSHICFDDNQGRWGDYRMTKAEDKARSKYLKSKLYFKSPLAQGELVSLFQRDPGALNAMIIGSVLGVKTLKAGKDSDKILQRNRKRWGEFRAFVQEQRLKLETPSD